MKKTLRFVGMAVMAFMVCVNFVACSDDDDSNGNGSDAKRLVSCKTVSENDTYITTFYYDSYGRICKEEERSENYDDDITTTYEYGANTIIKTVCEGRVDRYEYILVNGLIVSYKFNGEVVGKFQYDDGRLVKISSNDYYGDSNLTWEDCNIKSVVSRGEFFSYNDLDAANGWNDDYDFIDHVLYNAGYFGEPSRNLISFYNDEHDPYYENVHYTYELDSDGYVIRKTGSNGYSRTYTWK